jgi:putative addiction module component (TIGR02574 family)
MTVIAQRIEKDIRELSLEEMLALHETLLASIDEKENAQNLDPAYADEIRRRITEIDSGKTEGTDAFQSLKEM